MAPFVDGKENNEDIQHGEHKVENGMVTADDLYNLVNDKSRENGNPKRIRPYPAEKETDDYKSLYGPVTQEKPSKKNLSVGGKPMIEPIEYQSPVPTKPRTFILAGNERNDRPQFIEREKEKDASAYQLD